MERSNQAIVSIRGIGYSILFRQVRYDNPRPGHKDWLSIKLYRDTELFETAKQGYQIWPLIHRQGSFDYRIAPTGELYAFRAEDFEHILGNNLI